MLVLMMVQSVTASTALLPSSRAWVSVGPPLSCKLASKLVTAAVLILLHAPLSCSSIRLLLALPLNVPKPAQSPFVLLVMIEFCMLTVLEVLL